MTNAQDAAIDAYEAKHPPRETVTLWCRSDDYEFEADRDDPNRDCPICSRPAEVI